MTKKKNGKAAIRWENFLWKGRVTVAANPDRVERADEDCWIVLLLLCGMVLINWFYSLLLMIILFFPMETRNFRFSVLRRFLHESVPWIVAKTDGGSSTKTFAGSDFQTSPWWRMRQFLLLSLFISPDDKCPLDCTVRIRPSWKFDEKQNQCNRHTRILLDLDQSPFHRLEVSILPTPS